MLSNFLLIYAVNLSLIILVFKLYIVLVHLCTVHAKSVMNHACVMFCHLSLSAPHFQNVCIWNTVWKRVISNYINWNAKWVKSDFACYWYFWNTVQKRMVLLLNYEIWNEKDWTGIDDQNCWVLIEQLMSADTALIKYCPLIG